MLTAQALDILELLPVWRQRPTRPPVQWQCIVVNDEQARTGWVVLSATMEADSALLFEHILKAMKLRRMTEINIPASDLLRYINEHKPNWLWLTEPTMQVNRIEQPVLVSPAISKLLVDPLAKAQLWADWCVSLKF